MKKLKLMGHIEKDLTQDEFNKINKARETLKRIMEQETLYDQVLESLISFKSEMYEYNLRSAQKFLHGKYIENYEIRSSLNRLAFNLLNFGKLYLDKHYRANKNTSFVLRVTNDQEAHISIEKKHVELGSSNYEYLLGCQLRNYVQHDILPINTLRKKYEENISRFTIPVLKSELKSDTIKPYVLIKFDDEIDLYAVLEGYVYAISQCHELNRKLIEDVKSEALFALKSTSININNECHEKNRNVLVIDKEGDNEKTLFTLSIDWFDVVNYLEEKNKVFIDWNKLEFKGHSN